MVALVSNELLPPSATAQERAQSAAISRLSDVPVLVRESWNPDTCPASLLPWLAWAYSVDDWDAEWTEQEKRDVIKQSLYVHKKKGTISAIERALTPLGYLIDVEEWWETTPRGVPFTFKIVVGTTTKPISDDTYPKIEQLVNSSKNERSQLTGITIKAEVSGNLYAAAVVQSGEETTVYPHQISEQQVAGAFYYAAATQIIDTVSVRPQP